MVVWSLPTSIDQTNVFLEELGNAKSGQQRYMSASTIAHVFGFAGIHEINVT